MRHLTKRFWNRADDELHLNVHLTAFERERLEHLTRKPTRRDYDRYHHAGYAVSGVVDRNLLRI